MGLKSFEGFIFEGAAPNSAKSSKYCCKDFEAALEEGTNDEEFGAAIHPALRDKTAYTIGAGLKPIKFCPWCGTKVSR